MNVETRSVVAEIELEYEVDYVLYPGCKETADCPEDAGEIDIHAVRLFNGHGTIDITNFVSDHVIDVITEIISDQEYAEVS